MVKSKSHNFRILGVHLFLLTFLFFVIYPLMYVVSISFRSGHTLVDPENFLIPSSPTLEHWALALEQNYTGMNPLKKDIDGVDTVSFNNGLGTVTYYADGRWTLDADPAFDEADYPLESYLAIAFLDNFGERLQAAGSDENGFIDRQKIVLDVADNEGLYEDALFISPDGQLSGQLSLPDRPADADRATLQYGDAYVSTPPYPVLSWLMNTVKVATITSILVLLLSTTSAYAFGRLGFYGKGPMLKTLLVLQQFPNTLFLTALYLIFEKLGSFIGFMSLNTHSALIIGYMGSMALNIFMIIGYFDTIDPSMEESAAIDGATPWQTFYRILLPLSVPILAVVFILTFINIVNEFPLASVLISDIDKMTLAVGAQQFIQAQNQLWGDFAAAAVLAGIPITIVFLIAQRFLVGGLTAGGVKG
ncbi:maltose ABC transporter permease MalG [Reinekea blandensis]|uniref:Maltose/maltodextrin transport system permease protein MalG n=1 Tax=Reinekea blandensis MED297 TaxID=314283 RepID=A4B997_9GAMM|nr:maltose ABC transporter permease MalG [Reinekea blandensis]EAR11198.1 maltose ABC transporter, permease protein [Reinekea sp. MED297] [Reinekea blandensis MED297]